MADPDRNVRLLAELVELESPSGDEERLERLANKVAKLLTNAGARAEVRPGGHLLAEMDGSPGATSHVLVLGHLDTVWPAGRLATAPFTVVEGTATGPGVFDMKAGIVALVLALESLRSRPRAHRVSIVLTADEEIGSPVGAGYVTERLNDVDAVFALEPPLAHGTLKVGRRGVARIRLQVTGRESHAGLDLAAGVSATAELVDQLTHITSLLPTSHDLSVNIGTLAGGSRANVVAGAAEAELGLRFANAEAERHVFDTLDRLRPIRDDAQVGYTLLSHRPAWEPAGSAVLSEYVRGVAAEFGETVTAAVSAGAGDANLTGARGVPTVDGLGPRGNGAHSVNEVVELSSIRIRANILAQLLARPLP